MDIPCWMRCDPNIKINMCEHSEDYWDEYDEWLDFGCNFHGIPCPKETLAERWIRDNKCDPPEWMRCNCNNIPFTWIRCVQTDPPEWMRHDNRIQNVDGNTLAMVWIIANESEPPEWMRHKSIIKNKYGETILDLWIENVKTDPPYWMKI